MNKDKNAEERFKAINEAYEVLKDEDKRKRYDALGNNWKAGQDFNPPPGMENVFDFSGGRASTGATFDFNNLNGFSDFFSAFFGGQGGAHPGRPAPAQGRTYEVEVPFTIDELYRADKKTISLSGGGRLPPRSYSIKIPVGTVDGGTIRLGGQGERSDGGAGDLLIRVKVVPSPRYQIDGSSLIVDTPITPAQAVLGAKIDVSLPGSMIRVTVPANSSSGNSLRLKGKGMLLKDNERGDCELKLRIVVPESIGPEELRLYKELLELEANRSNTKRAV